MIKNNAVLTAAMLFVEIGLQVVPLISKASVVQASGASGCGIIWTVRKGLDHEKTVFKRKV